MSKTPNQLNAELYPKIYYEDVKVKPNENIEQLLHAYGLHNRKKVKDFIWNSPKNSQLKSKRISIDDLQPGDVIYIPVPPIQYYEFHFKTVPAEKDSMGKKGWPAHGWVSLVIDRYGNNNTNDFSKSLATTPNSRLRWVHTVYQGNQPNKGTTANCVDACPANDNDPFYYATNEYNPYEGFGKTKDYKIECGSEGVYENCYRSHASFSFRDRPSREWPKPGMQTTHWRGILSLVAVYDKRVTLVWTGKWGFDLEVGGKIKAIELRKVTSTELSTHLNQLKNGKGVDQSKTFSKAGWEFRLAPSSQFAKH